MFRYTIVLYSTIQYIKVQITEEIREKRRMRREMRIFADKQTIKQILNLTANFLEINSRGDRGGCGEK